MPHNMRRSWSVASERTQQVAIIASGRQENRDAHQNWMDGLPKQPRPEQQQMMIHNSDWSSRQIKLLKFQLNFHFRLAILFQTSHRSLILAFEWTLAILVCIDFETEHVLITIHYYRLEAWIINELS